MKRINLLIFLVLGCLISMGSAQVQNTILSRLRRDAHGSRLLQKREPSARHYSQLPAFSNNTIPTQCPPDAIAFGAAACGYVKVPLDRDNPRAGKIRIYFELYLHSSSEPAESAILANVGGPGITTTGIRDFWLFLYGANLDVHDLLLIDDRGRGFSTTIECEELQHGTAPFDQAESDCAAQLGNAASRYGTGDIAQDTEAVRAALGYHKVDYHGGSYGGADVTAYATRFGEHLRSIVLDAPAGAPVLEPFVYERDRTHSMPRSVRLQCLRSPTCAADHSSPDSELNSLISTIKAHPVEGDGYDANGNLVHVRVDEHAVLNYMIANTTGNFINSGEILAAASSLSQGDAKPLLRLGAEGSQIFFLVNDYGDPTSFSFGAKLATLCVDVHPVWDWSAPVSTRMSQYAAALRSLPSNYFAPFSKATATNLLFSELEKQCFWWQKPSVSSPVAPENASYPNVPTLVLNGDIDNNVPLETTTKIAALFPNSTLVVIPEAGHESAFWSQCARDLASRFIQTLQTGDTSCATTPEFVFPAVGRFPLFAKDARPATVDPTGGNRIGTNERKVVTVAVAAATDALQRSFIGFGDGVGLRAGAFHTDYGDSAWTTTLSNCAFATDVTVNGTVTWSGSDASFVADLQVSGGGTGGGSLHVEGNWQGLGPVGNFKVSGLLGNKRVAVLVSES